MYRFMMLFLLSTAALAQERSVRGFVRDQQTGLALPGASIVVQHTHRGTITDEGGRFFLGRLPQTELTLEARLLGYASQTITLAGAATNAEITFQLQPMVLPLQNMLVTASRTREESFVAGYAHLQQQQIQERYAVQDLPVLLAEMPSTNFYSESGSGLGYTYLNVRGFDQRRISVMINGVPQNDPEDHMVYWLDFPDLAANLESLQVQRGAGNMWGGTPTIGGAINLISSNFTRRRGIAAFTGMGSYNTRKVSLSASSGLMENQYALYARLSKITSDGYRENSWTNLNSYFLGVARFDKNMTTQINVYGGPVSDHLAYYGISRAEAADKKLRRNNPIRRKEEIENFSQPHYELIHEWQWRNWKWQNTLFYVSGEGFFDYDGSWAPYSYFRLTPENGFSVVGDPESMYIPNALIHAYVQNRQLGWLPRVVRPHHRGVLTAGAEWRRHRSFHYGSLKWGEAIPQGVTPDYHYYEYRGAKDIASLFLNEVYQASDRLNLLLDLVFVSQSYRLYDEKYVHTDFAKPYRFFNPKAGMSYRLSDEFRFHTTFARTSREPRLKNLYNAGEASTTASWGAVTPQFALQEDGRYDFSRPLVKEETMYDAELGGSYERANLSLSVNFYNMNFKNEIVKSGQLDRFGQPVTGNAEKTLHRGVELSLRLRPAPSWEITANSTWSRNRLVRHRHYTWDGVQVLDGRPIAGFPDLLANGRVSYRNERINLSLSGRYVGGFYTSHFEREEERVPAFYLFDVIGRWNLPVHPGLQGLQLQVQISNLLNKLYIAHGEGDEFFPAAERNFFIGLDMEL